MTYCHSIYDHFNTRAAAPMLRCIAPYATASITSSRVHMLCSTPIVRSESSVAGFTAESSRAVSGAHVWHPAISFKRTGTPKRGREDGWTRLLLLLLLFKTGVVRVGIFQFMLWSFPYTHIHTHTHIYTHTHTYTHIHTHAHTYTHTYTYTYIHIHIHIR